MATIADLHRPHSDDLAPSRRLPGRRRLLERDRGDRGAVTTEIVLVLPLLFTLVLLIAQITVWAHATHMAQATASHALSATRVEDGTAQSGRSDAQQVLDQLGHGPLRGAHISVTRDVESASVRVEGTATSVVPFLHLPVHAEAAGPVEKFHLADQAAP
ncbi:TadE/TadG family type IV pilus assembly protein [Streptomyces melanosporofaciens]|uniref:TadE-like protein n=1 Tax=Streptomyces melanosporofaciens TaxID=67327 RepID=A0A1H4KQF6_STRMJ|nr:TadE/TadG family type IV pilus assembly protein [Streptomyces melanosporofaciens]SEB60780.1 TadE-like protein [Streptomyces melanosporofaciens]